jgi:hypothetical protein
MGKPKRKLTAAEKAEKKRRRQEYMTIFINGRQKRVKRPPTINGMDVAEFIRRNADPIWLHQNEMWEYIEPIPKGPWQVDSEVACKERAPADEEAQKVDRDDDDDIPF